MSGARERPILFSAPMVRAILDGRKTVTRRIVKAPDVLDWVNENDVREFPDEYTVESRSPFGVPGDRLWVRETWFSDHLRSSDEGNVIPDREECVYYRADADRALAEDMVGCWKPSIFMPRWASRITLEVTGVRVERLQEITEEDVLAEGVTVPIAAERTGIPWSDIPTLYRAWELCWDSINGKRAPWSADPWVWRVAFRRLP